MSWNDLNLILRIGHGYDIHAIIPGDGIYLGGAYIQCGFSLKGHSDADVVMHSLTDAILGAISEYDIGHFFSDKKQENKDRDSNDFLQFALRKMKDKGYIINNIDCTILCEIPSISLYRQNIRSLLTQYMHINIDQISIKGKTHEKLDSIGRGEAIAAHTIVLLSKSLTG